MINRLTCPLTVHPTEKAVPSTSSTVPTSFLAMLLLLRVRAILITASRVILPLPFGYVRD